MINWIEVPNVGLVSESYILKADWDSIIDGKYLPDFDPISGSSNSLYQISTDPLVLSVSPQEGIPVHSSVTEFVTAISWYEAIIWCNALSISMDLDPVYYVRDTLALVTPRTTVIEGGRTYIREVVLAETNGVRLLSGSEWASSTSYVDSIQGVAEWVDDKGRDSKFCHERFVVGIDKLVECNSQFKLPDVTLRVMRGN